MSLQQGRKCTRERKHFTIVLENFPKSISGLIAFQCCTTNAGKHIEVILII